MLCLQWNPQVLDLAMRCPDFRAWGVLDKPKCQGILSYTTDFYQNVIIICQSSYSSDGLLYCLYRSEVASANTWTAPTGALTPSSVISFDGAGYLFVEQFSDIDDFVQNLRSIVVITRPNEESDGLVMYAYDEEVSTWGMV